MENLKNDMLKKLNNAFDAHGISPVAGFVLGLDDDGGAYLAIHIHDKLISDIADGNETKELCIAKLSSDVEGTTNLIENLKESGEHGFDIIRSGLDSMLISMGLESLFTKREQEEDDDDETWE